MNEGTRKAANALVAVVDFMAGALAEEAQATAEKQRQLDQFATQLPTFATQLQEKAEALEAADSENARALLSVVRLRGLVEEAIGHIRDVDVTSDLRRRLSEIVISGSP